VLPTDGYKAPDDFQRIIGGQLNGRSDKPAPKPSMAPAGNVEPSLGALGTLPMGPAPQQQRQQPAMNAPPPSSGPTKKKAVASSAPGFGL
jgi:pilus assembly protein CpaC